ncbi:MAG TPA: hypothetical protein VLE02_01545 [Nitrosarchaeum sp.]|nr:hypothetical protein [Nitrosarchaeum sp.]
MQQGKVYLVFYPINFDNTQKEPLCHSSVIVDFAGESTAKEVIGYEMHITPKEDGGTELTIRKNSVISGAQIYSLGRLTQRKKNNPFSWAIEVTSDIARLYNNLVNIYGTGWSDFVNCHAFSLLVIEKLGLFEQFSYYKKNFQRTILIT